MQARVRLFGHSVHAAVVRVPLVLFPLLVGFDILHALTDDRAFWVVGGWLAMAGVAGGIASILTGTVDLASIPPGGRPQRLALWHLVGGIGLHSLYILSAWARWPPGSEPHNVAVAVSLDVAGFVAVAVQGFLGAELRDRYHIGIPSPEEGAEPVPLRQRYA